VAGRPAPFAVWRPLMAARSLGRRPVSRRNAVRFAAILVCLALAWGGGLFWFAALIPDKVKDGTTRTDAIVVLTGGSGRLGEGLRLLAGDRARKLFISGVYRGVDVKTLLHLSQRQPGELDARVGIGDAVNTTGNAQETARWIAEEGFQSLRLVTAAYHMPRSLLEFRYIMPKVKLIPHPVFPGHVKQDQWWAWPGTAALFVSEYNKFLLASLRQAASVFSGRVER